MARRKRGQDIPIIVHRSSLFNKFFSHYPLGLLHLSCGIAPHLLAQGVKERESRQTKDGLTDGRTVCLLGKKNAILSSQPFKRF